MSITLTFSSRRPCVKCGEVYELRDMSRSDPHLCLWCASEKALISEKSLRDFEDHDLSIADLASMAQQGKRTLRRIPKAWRVW